MSSLRPYFMEFFTTLFNFLRYTPFLCDEPTFEELDSVFVGNYCYFTAISCYKVEVEAK